MRIDEFMDTQVLTISVNDYAFEAKRLMAQQACDWMIALDRADVAGVVFAQELERASEAALKERDVREYVSAAWLRVNRDIQPQAAERLLRRSGYDLMVVVDENGLVGIVTLDTLAHQHSKGYGRWQAG